MPLCDRCKVDLNYPQELPPEVDRNLQIISIPAREVHFTTTELNLLRLFWSRRGQQVASERIITYLWGHRPPEREIDTLHVHINRLRKKLIGSPYLIRNHYGSYSFWILSDGI